MELAVAMGLTGEATAATVITGSKSGFSESRTSFGGASSPIEVRLTELSRTSDFSTFFAGRFAAACLVAGRFVAGLEEASLLLAVVFLVDFFGMSVSLLH